MKSWNLLRLECLTLLVVVVLASLAQTRVVVQGADGGTGNNKATLLSSMFRGGRSLSPRAPQEAPSYLLRLQSLYLQQPPHDTALYDCLQVSPNATSHQISQSYRRLCRKYHPDKRRGSAHEEDDSSSSLMFEQVQKAHQILKDDATRLAYHRYGLIDAAQAVQILKGTLLSSGASPFRTAGRGGGIDHDENGAYHDAEAELLLLMGYAPPWENDSPSASRISQEERMERIARHLVERLRVVVEGRVPLTDFLNDASRECTRLKRLPLGAHIVRCVGRAYKHSGRKALSSLEWRGAAVTPTILWTERLRERFRKVKHFADAAVASGRAVLAEQHLELNKVRWDHQRRKVLLTAASNRLNQNLAFQFDTELGELTRRGVGSDDNDDDDDAALDIFDALHQFELQQQQHLQTQSTLLEALQIEALWKVTKIELDYVVRMACEAILATEACLFCTSDSEFGFNTSSSPPSFGSEGRWDGWVGSRSGVAISATEGRRRAAEALVQLGNVMVEQSKDGTSWLE